MPMVIDDYHVIFDRRNSNFCQIIAEGVPDTDASNQAHRNFISAFIKPVSIIFSHTIYKKEA